MYTKKNDGILKKGYGIVYKAVMTDERLSLTAKGIYAYLCSYSGPKTIIFPSRARILSELNLSKNAYYKHFNQLIELEYIVIKKCKNFFNRNQYVINDKPSTVRTENNQQEEAFKANGIKSLGYGIIPKSVMTNPNLTAKAKGLMAYFYALAGNGTGAFPTKKVIQKQLGISNTAYYNALHQLVENNYLTITQRKSEGKFEQNEYVITNFTSSQNKDTEKVEKRTPCTQKCDIQNCDNNNNNKVYNKNNISLNKYHISSSYSKISIRKRSKSDKLIARIKELCYYDDMIDSITDKSFKAIYNTAVTALVSLATKPFTHREEKINESDIHNLIKLSTREDTYGLSLRDLLYTVIEKFMVVKEKYSIHNITGYLKSMLYTEMLVGEF
ncbi:MAG: helix-turn-helix domain-containing protein [Acutalibacteraceae bacterium]|nr:helix-turn-helix domain-containing protein [Acutalibacteraceae bacterium]